MNSTMFYLGAAGLFGLSVILRKGTEPYAECGAQAYEKRRIRRLIGTILLLTAVICLGIAILIQFVSSEY
jgi:hypothetical protein